MLPGFPLGLLVPASTLYTAQVTVADLGGTGTRIGYVSSTGPTGIADPSLVGGGISKNWVPGYASDSVVHTVSLNRMTISFVGNAMALLSGVVELRINGVAYTNGGSALFTYSAEAGTTSVVMSMRNPFIVGQIYTLELA